MHLAGFLKRESQLVDYTHLVYLICNSISFQPKIVAKFLDREDLVKDLLTILANYKVPVDVSIAYNYTVHKNDSFLFLAGHTRKRDCSNLINALFVCR